ncbi:phosphoribosylaminoimidazolecarboxamide formyltransferase/IMP cyclohydrolase [Brucella suis]|nr:phosphoribosylaminoimidazolecarboxamide formyltransferase/IMP cyclohydrolase [Brucella suis]
MEEHGIGGIDLAVINLYPFEEVRFKGGDYDTTVENIDIGGPAMIRASAKNHAYVATVVDPADYADVVAELEKHSGSLPLAFRKKLAAKAFSRTAAYDAAISNWFAEAIDEETPTIARLPASCIPSCATVKTRTRRLAFISPGESAPGVATATQLQASSFPITHQRYRCGF